MEVTPSQGRPFRATILGLAPEGYVRLDAGDTFEFRIADVDTFEIL